MYQYETTYPIKESDERFPPGSRMAAYGAWSADSVDEAMLLYPCTGKKTGRNPGCSQVLQALGIDEITSIVLILRRRYRIML